MAKIMDFFLLLCFLFVVSTSGDLLDNMLRGPDDISSCIDVCSNTYSPHTSELIYLYDGCKRGCRLFSIMELMINDDNDRMNLTQKGCISSCKEAYNKTEEVDACSLGCKSQVPQALKQREQMMNEEPSIHLLYPLMYVHNLYSNMIDKVYRGMSVSWSYYMQSDNGKVIIVRSEPQFFMDIDPEESDDEYNTATYLETNLAPLDRSATPMLRNSQVGPQRSDDEIEFDFKPRDRDSQSSADWLSCVSKRTGLPRLFLSLLLLSCASMMIWLCLAAIVTSPEHKVKTDYQKLSINGDLEYLRELEAMGVKLKPVYPQSEGEAGPLPIKLKVDRV